jgi:hypothetical protein
MRTTRDLKRVWRVLTQELGEVHRPDRGVADRPAGSRGWLHDAGVNALGIAEKTRRGLGTGRLAIVVYVDAKRPLSRVAHRIPPSVQVPGTRRRVPLDVVQRARMRMTGGAVPGANPERLRPGVAICCAQSPSEIGTLGLIVRFEGELALLSAGHVIARNGLSAPGTAILQVWKDPAGLMQTRKIAALARSVDVVAAAARGGLWFDAAIGKLEPALRGEADAAIPFLGRLAATRGRLQPDEKVFIYGATTRPGAGRIRSIHESCVVAVRGGAPLPATIVLQHVVSCSDYSDGGDSGAAVVSAGRFLVGLHFGTNGQGDSIFFPIEPILQGFGATLV